MVNGAFCRQNEPLMVEGERASALWFRGGSREGFADPEDGAPSWWDG